VIQSCVCVLVQIGRWIFQTTFSAMDVLCWTEANAQVQYKKGTCVLVVMLIFLTLQLSNPSIGQTSCAVNPPRLTMTSRRRRDSHQVRVQSRRSFACSASGTRGNSDQSSCWKWCIFRH
jgi:hypothetical protein